MSKYNNTDIEVREDGVYVLINTKSANVKNDILKVIQKYDVKDVDYMLVEEAIKTNKEEQRISLNKQILVKSENIDTRISTDKLTAYISFSAPINNGDLLSADEIESLLNTRGIKYGINHERIKVLAQKKQYGQWYEIANGKPPVPGIDGYIEFLFETEKKSLKPKVLEDGTVDYRSVKIFEMATKGQKLAILRQPVPAVDGINVNDKIIVANRPKNPPPLPKGKNTIIDESGTTLISEISGRIMFMYGKASVLPILEVSGNVDNGTGNIDFVGSVIVKGNVVAGFTINAGADVEVNGSIESAVIKAGGNIILAKGVQGANKAVIEAQGDINANFIESAVIIAGGDINANSIMHSIVKCGRKLTLMGKRGLLVGGKIIVGESINAKIVGSAMSTITELEVGFNPLQLEQYKENVKLIEKYTEDYKRNEKIIDVLSKARNDLSVEKKRVLMEAIRSKILIKSKINELQVKVSAEVSELNKRAGLIKASDIIYNGVKITINNAVMFVKDDIKACTLYNKDGKICIGSYN